MWCIVRPSWLQRRTVVLDVARPPERIETVCPGAVASLRWSSVTWMRQPPAGAGPAVAMSPPRLTSTPQPPAAWAAARGAVGGQRLGGRAEVEPHAVRQPDGARRARRATTVRQPLSARSLSTGAGVPAPCGLPVAGRGAAGCQSRS